jgi:malate permease and related proteins
MTGTEAFLEGLYTSLDIIGQMALLVLLGFILVRRGWIGSHTLSDITRFLIDAVIPAAFILAMTRSFSFRLLEQGAVLALVAAGWIVFSYVFGTLWFKLFPGGTASRQRAVTAMMMVSNTLYLPLPVILAVTPPELHDQAIVYISLIVVPSSMAMWTACVLLLAGFGSPAPRERLKLILNPPLLSLAAGILLSAVPCARAAARLEPGAFPPLVTLFQAAGYLSQLLSPVAMLVLGGMIAGVKGRGTARLQEYGPLLSVRLLVVPAVVFALLRWVLPELPPPAGAVLLLAAAAPPATNHALIARRYGGEWELVSSVQLIVHLAALLTLPVWLALGLSL